jgi:DNA modification methylase
VVQDWETALWNIPNVKANHPEKTIHPCQFPIELVERCILALTNEGDWVLDPFSGVGSALLAALKNKRRAFGCEKEAEYIEIARQRIADLYSARSVTANSVSRCINRPDAKRSHKSRWSGEARRLRLETRGAVFFQKWTGRSHFTLPTPAG